MNHFQLFSADAGGPLELLYFILRAKSHWNLRHRRAKNNATVESHLTLFTRHRVAFYPGLNHRRKKNKHLTPTRAWSRPAFLPIDQKLKAWARKITNEKPRKYNGMVGGPDVQTKKIKIKNETTWLFDWKYQHGLAFGPLLTCKNWRNFNPSRRANLSFDKGYPAKGADRLVHCFYVNAYKHLTAKGLPAAVIQPGVKSNPGLCKEDWLTKRQNGGWKPAVINTYRFSTIMTIYQCVGIFEISGVILLSLITCWNVKLFHYLPVRFLLSCVCLVIIHGCPTVKVNQCISRRF